MNILDEDMQMVRDFLAQANAPEYIKGHFENLVSEYAKEAMRAEQLLSDAYNSVSSAEAPDPELLKLVIDAYVKLFEESKHPEDAAIWKAKRDATGA